MEVDFAENRGAEILLHGMLGADKIIAKAGKQVHFEKGQQTAICINMAEVCFFNPDTEESTGLSGY